MRTIAAIALLAVASCSARSGDPPQPRPNASTAEASDNQAPGVVFMDAGDLAEAMHRDEAGALGRLRSKRVVLTGVVTRVGHTDQYMTEVVIHTAGRPGQLSLFAADDEIASARAEQPGHLVAVSCADVMGPADDITARDCTGWD